MPATKNEVIDLLKTAYSMELETVLSYLAHSTNLDGVRAEEIKKSLAADITAELGHATQLARRIKQLGGLIPGSTGVKFGKQKQPTEDTTDVIGVIEATIEAEEAAWRAVQENHQSHRRGRLRHARFMRHFVGRRGRTPGALQRIFEGIQERVSRNDER